MFIRAKGLLNSPTRKKGPQPSASSFDLKVQTTLVTLARQAHIKNTYKNKKHDRPIKKRVFLTSDGKEEGAEPQKEEPIPQIIEEEKAEMPSPKKSEDIKKVIKADKANSKRPPKIKVSEPEDAEDKVKMVKSPA